MMRRTDAQLSPFGTRSASMVLVAEFCNEKGTRYRQCNDPEPQKAYADLTTLVLRECHQPKQHTRGLESVGD
jgi:hypothetical protein